MSKIHEARFDVWLPPARFLEQRLIVVDEQPFDSARGVIVSAAGQRRFEVADIGSTARAEIDHSQRSPVRQPFDERLRQPSGSRRAIRGLAQREPSRKR